MSTGSGIEGFEFPVASREKWLALVGEAAVDTLISRTDDGIAIEPLMTRDPSAGILSRQNTGAPWIVVQRADDPDPVRANAQAKQDVAQGATGLALVFEGAPNAFGYGLPATQEALAAVLDDIPLRGLHLRVDVHPSSRAMADWLVALLTRKAADPSKLSLSFGIDPAAIFAGTGRLSMSIEALQASMPQSLAHFFAVGIPGVLLEADGRVFHNAGATEAQELGAMIAASVAHLRLFEEARQALVHAPPHIGFAISVDQDQFLSMAKIRALRQLWAKVLEACSVPPSPATIHAETSYRMMTLKDPETNILRTSIAGFAAAVGGADTISILPNTIAHGLPEGFARRVARNSQLLMASESHLDFVADPASGSGSVEALTDQLCQAAWREFQTIEGEGGILNSLLEGRLQGRVAAARKQRIELYRDGRKQIVGSTIYPPAVDRPVRTLDAATRPVPTEGAVFCERLAPHRIEQARGEAS